MKKLIFILFPVVLFGQEKDKWIYADQATRGFNFTVTPNSDTVRVIMLVCDTSFISGFTSGYYIGKDSHLITNRNRDVWWQFGYEVLEPWVWYNDGGWAYRPIKQLDQNKKPLPKSIVVWVSKDIKN